MPEPIGSGIRSLLITRTITVLSFVMLAQLVVGSLAFAASLAVKQAWFDSAQQWNAFALAGFALLVLVLYVFGRRRKQVQ